MSTIALISKTVLKYGKEVFCIDTGFGKVFLRTDADDDDKVRIFDSEGTYLDYIEAETFADVADEVGIDFRDAICEYANELALKDNVQDLLDSISFENFVATCDIEKAVKLSGCANQRELRRNEMINRIGPYFVVAVR